MKKLNQKGMITVDFIIAITILSGFTVLLLMLSLTLSMASVVQYITYSSARNYTAAHLDESKQVERAKAKYQELISNSVFKPLFQSGWFKIEKEAFVGDHTKLSGTGLQSNAASEYESASQGRNQFWGVGTNFTPQALVRDVAYAGSTSDDASGKGFETYMASYLGREPTADECMQFAKVRWKTIRNLPTSGAAPYATGGSEEGYYVMSDDGC